MFRFVALFAFVAVAAAGTPRDDFYGRIVGGKETTIDVYPYQVSLQTNSGGHFCGGSIINKDTIVTAAHCMQSYSKSEFKVRLGATNYKTGGELVSVRAFKFHEGYNSKLMINDVAIVKLDTPVAQSSNIHFIPLAKQTPATGTPSVVTGWGTTCYLLCSVSAQLQAVDVNIVTEKDCASSTYKYGDQIAETMVCAYNPDKDACQGDSGGPLVAEGKLVGIVSWGSGCARSGYPGVYADVASLREWIETNTANL